MKLRQLIVMLKAILTPKRQGIEDADAKSIFEEHERAVNEIYMHLHDFERYRELIINKEPLIMKDVYKAFYELGDLKDKVIAAINPNKKITKTITVRFVRVKAIRHTNWNKLLLALAITSSILLLTLIGLYFFGNFEIDKVNPQRTLKKWLDNFADNLGFSNTATAIATVLIMSMLTLSLYLFARNSIKQKIIRKASACKRQRHSYKSIAKREIAEDTPIVDINKNVEERRSNFSIVSSTKDEIGETPRRRYCCGCIADHL